MNRYARPLRLPTPLYTPTRVGLSLVVIISLCEHEVKRARAVSATWCCFLSGRPGLFSAQNKSAGARGGEEGEIYPSTSLTVIGHNLVRRAPGFVHGKYVKSFRQKRLTVHAHKTLENKPESPFLRSPGTAMGCLLRTDMQHAQFAGGQFEFNAYSGRFYSELVRLQWSLTTFVLCGDGERVLARL